MCNACGMRESEAERRRKKRENKRKRKRAVPVIVISSSESLDASNDQSGDEMDSVWDRMAACPPRPGWEVHPNILLPRETGTRISTPSVWEDVIQEMLDIPIEELVSPPESPIYEPA